MVEKQLVRVVGKDFCRVELRLEDGELSICGTVGVIGRRPAGGEDVGTFEQAFHLLKGKTLWATGGGQCVEEIVRFFPEMQPIMKWHLNTMRPGCEHQRAEGWATRPIDPSKPLDAYGTHVPGGSTTWNMLVWVTRQEHPEGLLSHPCPTCGYKYGSAWLKEELPPEVIAFVESFGEVA
jgi:hypothetical protein